MLDRLGTSGLFAVLVCVGGLLAAWLQKSTAAGIVGAVAGIFAIARLFRGGDA